MQRLKWSKPQLFVQHNSAENGIPNYFPATRQPGTGCERCQVRAQHTYDYVQIRLRSSYRAGQHLGLAEARCHTLTSPPECCLVALKSSHPLTPQAALFRRSKKKKKPPRFTEHTLTFSSRGVSAQPGFGQKSRQE